MRLFNPDGCLEGKCKYLQQFEYVKETHVLDHGKRLLYIKYDFAEKATKTAG